MSAQKFIPAATIIPIYEGENGLEVLMVKRNENLRFAGGQHAFAGGKIDAKDYEFANGNELLAAKVAAFREMHEETGIIFDQNANLIANPNIKNNFYDYARENKQAFDFDKAKPLSRWRPPPEIPIKFDTYFFFTKIIERIIPKVDGNEIVDANWLNVTNAIEKYKSGEIKTFFPTIINLHLLAKMQSFDALLEFANYENPPIIQTQSERIGAKTYQYIDIALDYPLYHASHLN